MNNDSNTIINSDDISVSHVSFGDGESEKLPLSKGISVNPSDVLCGRGKISSNHVGNKRFRETVLASLQKFKIASLKNDRADIVQSVIDTIHAIGGRFLRKDFHIGSWVELKPQQCREKVGHAIRDAVKAEESKQCKTTHDTRAKDNANQSPSPRRENPSYPAIVGFDNFDSPNQAELSFRDPMFSSRTSLGVYQPDDPFFDSVSLQECTQLAPMRVPSNLREMQHRPSAREMKSMTTISKTRGEITGIPNSTPGVPSLHLGVFPQDGFKPPRLTSPAMYRNHAGNMARLRQIGINGPSAKAGRPQFFATPSSTHYMSQVRSVANAGRSYLATRNRVMPSEVLVNDKIAQDQFANCKSLQQDSSEDEFDDDFYPLHFDEQIEHLPWATGNLFSTNRRLPPKYDQDRNERYNDMLDVINTSLGPLQPDDATDI